MATLRKIGLIITMTMTLALGSAHAVLADSCSMGRTPEGVYPINDTSVTMVNEDVKVIIEGGGSTATVDCRFTFKNAGAARSVLMGFPAYGLTWEKNLSAYDVNAAKLQNFRAYVDGSAVKVKEVKALAPPGTASVIEYWDANYYYSWYTFTVPFAAGETREVRNTYRVTLVEGNSGYSAGYILRTGRLWQGPIGHARITFDMGHIQPYEISSLDPYWLRFQGNNLVFEQSNFKPDYDLGVSFYGSDGSDMTDDYVTHFRAVEAKLPGMSRDELLKDNQAVQDKYPVLAAYISGLIPGFSIKSVPPHIGQVTVTPWPEAGCTKVSLQVSEPSADLTTLTLKVSHLENGQEVIDHEGQQAFGGCSYNYDTDMFSDPFKLADYTTFEEKLIPGREYHVAVSVQNAAGQSDSKVVSYKAEPGSLKESNSAVSAPVAPASAIKTAAPDYFTLSVTALVLLYIVIFLFYRIKKGAK